MGQISEIFGQPSLRFQNFAKSQIPPPPPVPNAPASLLAPLSQPLQVLCRSSSALMLDSVSSLLSCSSSASASSLRCGLGRLSPAPRLLSAVSPSPSPPHHFSLPQRTGAANREQRAGRACAARGGREAKNAEREKEARTLALSLS
eukprot:1121522-Rhodomonas_salina.2